MDLYAPKKGVKAKEKLLLSIRKGMIQVPLNEMSDAVEKFKNEISNKSKE